MPVAASPQEPLGAAVGIAAMPVQQRATRHETLSESKAEFTRQKLDHMVAQGAKEYPKVTPGRNPRGSPNTLFARAFAYRMPLLEYKSQVPLRRTHLSTVLHPDSIFYMQSGCSYVALI